MKLCLLSITALAHQQQHEHEHLGGEMRQIKVGRYEKADRDQGESLSLTDENFRCVIPGGASDETSKEDEQHLHFTPHWLADALSFLL